MQEPQAKNKMCYLCNAFVSETHECPQAKRMIENPVELKAPHIHSDATPTYSKGYMV